MSDKNYYNQYWQSQISGGVMNALPEWPNENLAWHYEFFKNYIGADVLDMGGGDGTFLDYIFRKSKVKEAVSLDISEIACEIGRKKYSNINFKAGAVEEVGNLLEPASFDTVFAIEVLEHILDVDACLDQIYKVLKIGGNLCVTTTDFNILKKVIIAGLFWDKFFYPNNPHIRFFTKNTLAEIARKHGLTLIDFKWNRSYFGLMPKGQMAVFKKLK